MAVRVDLYAISRGRAKAPRSDVALGEIGVSRYFAKTSGRRRSRDPRARYGEYDSYGISSELDKLRSLFDDQTCDRMRVCLTRSRLEEVSRSRRRECIARIEKARTGFEMEEELVKAALRTEVAAGGKEPVFRELDG